MVDQTKKRILFVAMQDSPHAARWINQLIGKGWDVHLFPVSNERVNPLLEGVTYHNPKYLLDLPALFSTCRYFFIRCRDELSLYFKRLRGEYAPSPYRAFDKSSRTLKVNNPLGWSSFISLKKRYVTLGCSPGVTDFRYGPAVLAKLVRKLKPDLIHSLELQHAGYLVLSARDLLGSEFPKWFVTNWGSDIYYYRHLPEHYETIVKLLSVSSYYFCECFRDVKSALELGFKGRVMPVIPNTGGFDIAAALKLRGKRVTSQRKILLVKGYQTFAGRALTALDALTQAVDLLANYRVIVYSASDPTIERVSRMRKKLGLNIEVLPRVSHDEMALLFSQARVYLGVSVSDGISTSMLEAMAYGAFPIQTNTACCDEWIVDNKSGFVIPVNNVPIIAERIRQALLDDQLVDNAATINWETVRNRLDRNELRRTAIEMYESIYDDIKSEAEFNKV